MDNHAHILIYSEKINELSNFMKKLNIAYATYYNEKEERTGYVFGSRYYTQVIENEIHLLACIKYIHENPVKAGIVNEPSEYQTSLNEIKKSNYLILKFKEYLNKKYKVSNKNICAILGIGKNRISWIEKRLK